MNPKHLKNAVTLVILILLLIIINGKFFFQSSSNVFFYIYGITVTSTIFMIFLVSSRYEDLSVKIIQSNLNKGKEKPLISCIVAVFNEEDIITQCIESMINSDYKNKEIIVVNDASTDNTMAVLNKYSKYSNVKILNLEKNVGKKRAIAKGIEIANGEIYVFTDSDSVIEKTAISKIIEIFIYDENIGAVSGHGRALNGEENFLTKVQDSWYEGQFSIKKAFESVFGCVSCISGPLAVFRKSAIYNFIPAWENDSFLGKEFKFSTDRTMTGFVLGSLYVGDQLKEKYANSHFVKSVDYPLKEWKLVYCKSAKVWTNVPNTFKKIIRQQIRWKKSFIRNIFFSGKFYWRKPLLPALRFYLGILFVIVGPFVVFRQMIYLPLNGNIFAAILYISGILFIGFLYGIAYKVENPSSNKWVYRPFMSIMSTLVFSWLIFYSLLTIKKGIWHRG